MKKQNWVNVAIMIGITVLIIIGLPFLVRPLIPSGRSIDWFWLIGIQELPVLVIIFMLNRFYVKQPVFYRLLGPLKNLIYLSLPIFLILLAIGATIILLSRHSFSGWSMLLDILAGTTLIGIAEEYLFRGLIFPQVLKALGTWTHQDLYLAVLISSLLFACIHVLNLTEQSLSATLIQMLGVFSIGCLFCAIYIRSGSLWLPIIFHSLRDFIVIGLDGAFLIPDSVTLSLIFDVGLLIIAAYDLRNAKLDQRNDWIEKLMGSKR